MARLRRRNGGSRFKRRKRRRTSVGVRAIGRVKRLSRKLFRKGIFNVETKFKEIGITKTINSWAGNMLGTNLFEGFSQGAGQSQYLGNSIFVRSINFWGLARASNPGSFEGAYPEQYVHVLIVRDKRPDNDNTTPPILSIFDAYYQPSITSQSEADANLFTFPWIANRDTGRFQWVYHKIFKLTNVPGLGFTKLLHRRIKINRKFDLAGTNMASGLRGAGQLYLYTWSNAWLDNGAGNDFNAGTLNCAWRVNYTDV